MDWIDKFKSKKALKIFTSLGVVLAAVLFLVIFIILCSKGVIKYNCPVYKFTGMYCPGCGGTRMITSLLLGNWYQSFRFNPLAFCIMPYIIFLYIKYIKDLIYIGRASDSLGNHLFLLAAIIIIYGVLRNTSLFSFLAPTVLN